MGSAKNLMFGNRSSWNCQSDCLVSRPKMPRKIVFGGPFSFYRFISLTTQRLPVQMNSCLSWLWQHGWNFDIWACGLANNFGKQQKTLRTWSVVYSSPPLLTQLSTQTVQKRQKRLFLDFQGNSQIEIETGTNSPFFSNFEYYRVLHPFVFFFGCFFLLDGLWNTLGFRLVVYLT